MDKGINTKFTTNSKYTENECNDKNILQYLKVLSQYYKTVDLPEIPEDDINLENIVSLKNVIKRLIDNSYILIRNHKKLQNQIKELQSEITQSENNYSTLKYDNSKLIQEREKLKNDNKILNQKFKLLNLEHEDDQKQIRELKQQIQQTKRIEQLKQDSYQHSIKKKEAINQQLNDKLEKNCGKYISVDQCLAKKLINYEENEKTYKETIAKLQQNNEDLLNEILNLKEQLIFQNLSNKR